MIIHLRVVYTQPLFRTDYSRKSVGGDTNGRGQHDPPHQTTRTHQCCTPTHLRGVKNRL
ncbi:hypothetical protein B0T21DRAFT_371645 [Apiosordaria backusii]|uniref:Uncharacterized protein n=1 Tax=Apiosordaria backusii TaxID=314023 RepID=A0AA40E469_9PEZI|nr:hypothetical protein B0T21DRAFT_371645 [Apiosordaria backusii]